MMPISIAAIQATVAERFDITVAEIVGAKRVAHISLARHIAMWIARSVTTRSMPAIGRAFGSRDHTSVIHAIRRIDRMMSEDADFADDVRELLRTITKQFASATSPVTAGRAAPGDSVNGTGDSDALPKAAVAAVPPAMAGVRAEEPAPVVAGPTSAAAGVRVALPPIGRSWAQIQVVALASGREVLTRDDLVGFNRARIAKGEPFAITNDRFVPARGVQA